MTLLDPRFKTYSFPGITTDLDDEKEAAMEALKGTYARFGKIHPVVWLLT